MAWDALSRDADDDNKRDRDKWVGVWIGVLAVLLAICTAGGDNAAKDAAKANLDASNTWAFFQAKNVRRHTIRLQVDELEILLLANPQMPAEAKKAIGDKIAGYKELDKRLTSDPKDKEGLDELFQKAKSLEAQRDAALARDPYFDLGAAALQIGIVLASIAIVISSGTSLLAVSFLLGGIGAAFTLNGYLSLFSLPFLH